MSGVDQEASARLDQRIRACEGEGAERLALLDVFEQEWGEYRRVMRTSSAQFEEACLEMGEKDYFVQKSLDSRREVDAYVRMLVDEQVELLEETARDVRTSTEVELERLRHEKAGA